MDPPLPAVVICEENRTRADLYSLWLDTYDVRVATTKAGVADVLDEDVGVAVVNQAFADGSAESVVDDCKAHSPMARIVATRDQSEPFPSLPSDEDLQKPVFEDELVATVDCLIHRANFHVALKAFYQVSIGATSLRMNAERNPETREQLQRLEERADELRTVVAAVTSELDKADVEAVRRAISFEGSFGPREEGTTIDSKYLPPKCSKCESDWSGVGSGGDEPVAKLGAHVVRCTECGAVHMLGGGGNNRLGSYRR